VSYDIAAGGILNRARSLLMNIIESSVYMLIHGEGDIESTTMGK